MGFIANIDGQARRDIVDEALTIVERLIHRGGTGADVDTGDGAGILMAMPHKFFVKESLKEGVARPGRNAYAVAQIFLPRDMEAAQRALDTCRQIISQRGFQLLLERKVPYNYHECGPGAQRCMPRFIQLIVTGDFDDLERHAYILRRALEVGMKHEPEFYIASLSTKTIVYKGMLHAWQLRKFFPDLDDPDMETSVATVHSRFSTNTFPSWDRAQPCRYIAHNGEINTLRGNENWFKAKEGVADVKAFRDVLDVVIPVIDEDGSDSVKFDNCLEFLSYAGRPMPQVLLTMIPEAWSHAVDISSEMKSFYEYSACMMEPWDGPASICFSDGRYVGSILDRNGLRPARYMITNDRRVVLASEVGVIDVDQSTVISKGRLGPGEMILVDTDKGEVYLDKQVKQMFATRYPYEKWLGENRLILDEIDAAKAPAAVGDVPETMRAFGYTYELIEDVLVPMASMGKEPIGAMGIDSPIAVLSDQYQPLFNYFKQLFAQVTNPPIDALREKIVTGTELFLGASGNFTEEAAENCKKIRIETPILSKEDFAKVRSLDYDGIRACTLDILYDVDGGGTALEKALEDLFEKAEKAIADGYTILILTDRGFSQKMAGMPTMLAVSGLHHHLIRAGLRGRADIVLDSAEPVEVHHFACLVGYGVSGIHPWGAIAAIEEMVDRGYMIDMDDKKKAVVNYLKSITDGIIKIMSKMGISAVASYQGAQVFEILGLAKDVVDKYFTNTVSRIGGLTLCEIADETKKRHMIAYGVRAKDPLPSGGLFQYKADGEKHMYNPRTIHLFQRAVRENDYALYKEYSKLITGEENTNIPVPLEEVEPVEKITQRFKTGAMSYGSLSEEAHTCLAIAMNRLGGKSNSGEGGENACRFVPMENGDSACSKIKQVASGRFGVTASYLMSGIELQIKMAQGAKPGEGGHLPGTKVYPWIAQTRHSTPGVGLISPPPHHDIYSIEDLAQLIFDLKKVNPNARVNVKLVSEGGVGTIAAGVAKAMADVILISGYDGGTGASPRTSIQHAGLPWELGVAETHQTLVLNGLRDRVLLETDGKMMTGRDVAIAALLGAEEYGFATLPLVAMGCVMMRVCNLNTCPVGVATQNPKLRAKFAGKPEYVENTMKFIARELREYMAMLGYRTLDEMIGRTHHLKQKACGVPGKASTVDLSALLSFDSGITRKHLAPLAGGKEWNHYFELIQSTMRSDAKFEVDMDIRNTDRTVGARVGGWIAKRFGDSALEDGKIVYNFKGAAGQSFGAFMPKGMTLKLKGEANDYVAKGLCGGEIVIAPPDDINFVPENNTIIGNVACYGATSGKLFVRGQSGHRFCVRNSGVHAVVEGIGEHGCEYMTGGIAVILGDVGYNFGAGMSGGVAYVYNKNGKFMRHCNQEMVSLKPVEEESDVSTLKSMIAEHQQKTGSTVAKAILDNFDEELKNFIKVLPDDYHSMMVEIEKAKQEGLAGMEMLTVAFERTVAK
jgi:glutamate synthase (ferredoxin)